MSDKLPPQDINAEQVILGSAISNTETAAQVVVELTTADFYRTAHQAIFNAIGETQANGAQGTSLLTVVAKLRASDLLEEAGGVEYVGQLGSFVGRADEWRSAAKIIHECTTQREVIRWANRIMERAYQRDDVPTLVGDIVSDAVRIADTSGAARAEHIGTHFEPDLENILTAINTPMGITPARWGIPELDKQTGGLGNFYLILLMAGSGAGKTRLANHAVMSSMQQFMAQPDPPAILVFPLEEGRQSWLRNAVSWEGHVDSVHLLPGRCPDAIKRTVAERVADADSRLVGMPFLIGEGAESCRDIVSRIRVESQKQRLGLVLVDYLQRLSSDTQHEREQLATVAKSLQTVSEELSLPIMLLSQMSLSNTTGELLPYGGRGPQFDASLAVVIDRDSDAEEERPLPSGTIRCLKSRGVPEFAKVAYSIDYQHGARYYDRDTWHRLNMGNEHGRRLDVRRDEEPFDARNN